MRAMGLWAWAGTLMLFGGCADPGDLAEPASIVDPFVATQASRWLAGEHEAVLAVAERRSWRLRGRGDDVRFVVIVEPTGSPADLDPGAIRAAGGELDAISRSWARVLVPPQHLGELAALPSIRRIRAPIPHHPTGFGATVSQSVGLTGADAWQDAGFTGAGVKAAVVDGGFQQLTDIIDDGELPETAVAVHGGTVVAWEDIELYDPHGVGVAEHMLDMAPGVELYCVLVEDEVDLENAADFMATEGIVVANQSLSWTGQSYYDDTGPITTIVNESRDDDGVFWAVSAGNHAEGHWRGGWLDDDGDSVLAFDGTDEGMGLTGEFDVTVVLNWDQYDNPETDLDLYLYAADGTEVMASTYPQGPWYGPMEAVWTTFDGGQAPYHVEVTHENGPTAGLDITLVSYLNDLEHQVPSSSVGEPADAHGAFTVGAVNQGNWSTPAIAGYSGQGPTNDGRDKPDIVAPDATECATYGTAYGTSMSSPTVAGAAALLLEADPAMTPEMVAHALRVMAEDAGDAGFDPVFGAGLLDLPLDVCIDGDGDGYGSGAFGNAHCAIADVDCDDTEASTYPGAADGWYDGVDSDCGGEDDYDQDGDGHGSDAYGGDDCDDLDGAVNPDATDPWYDGLDTDCSGGSDFDADGDGFDSAQYEGEDCDDGDDSVHPDAAEVCDDEIDNDCDGSIDLEDDECDVGDDDDDSAAGDDDDDSAAGDDDDDATPRSDDDDDGGCECSLPGHLDGGRGSLLVCTLLGAAVLRRRR